MKADPKCSRCGVIVPAVMAGPPDKRDTWWRYTVRVQTRSHQLRFNRWTRRWLPEDPSEQASLAYTDLDLCDDCSRAVFLFAQGKEAVA